MAIGKAKHKMASTTGEKIALRGSPLLAVIVPCYNEEAVLPQSIGPLIGLLEGLEAAGSIKKDSFLVFIDDGSTDTTWEMLSKFTRLHSGRCVALRLASNSGHQNALLAGVEFASSRSDAAVTIDADLQDDLSVVGLMVEHYRNGSELVLGVRSNRRSDSRFKRTTAGLYYRIMHILDVKITHQHADFRLMSRTAMSNLQQFGEYHIFLRGLIRLLHNRISYVYYSRAPRLAGETKYPIRKMLSLAWNGVTSFSVAPLRMIGFLGGGVFFISILLLIYALIAKLDGSSIPGWASITVPLYALGGLNMLSLAIVGEYVGKIYMEVKRRPRYIIDKMEVHNDP